MKAVAIKAFQSFNEGSRSQSLRHPCLKGTAKRGFELLVKQQTLGEADSKKNILTTSLQSSQPASGQQVVLSDALSPIVSSSLKYFKAFLQYTLRKVTTGTLSLSTEQTLHDIA